MTSESARPAASARENQAAKAGTAEPPGKTEEVEGDGCAPGCPPDSGSLPPPEDQPDSPFRATLRVLLRVLLAHAAASYVTVPLMQFWGLGFRWLFFVLAPLYVVAVVLLESLRLMLSAIGMGFEWSWTQPATTLGVYAGLLSVFLCIVWWLGNALEAKRRARTG